MTGWQSTGTLTCLARVLTAAVSKATLKATMRAPNALALAMSACVTGPTPSEATLTATVSVDSLTAASRSASAEPCAANPHQTSAPFAKPSSKADRHV